MDDGEQGTFVHPGASPEFFEHMTDIIKVKFLGENWEKGPWLVPNKFPPNTKAGRHSHPEDTIYVVMRSFLNFNDDTGWYKPGDVR